MIDPKELRIGNFIYCNATHRVVKANWVHADFKDLDPIPLTAEWLVSLGFEVYDRGGPGRFYKDGYIIDPNDSSSIYPYNLLTIHEDGVLSLKSLRYIHELQNLFFALADEELTLKELV
jgi:hypothetical protein